MRIILLQDVKNIGKKSEVKEVSDGYAKNFLLPRKLAKLADDKSIKEIEIKKSINEKKGKELKDYLEIVAKKLAETKFIFYLNVGKKGEIYNSLIKDDIKEKICSEIKELRKYEKEIEIKLEKPLKTLGEYEIEINLGKGIKCKIKIKLEPLPQ